MSEARTLVDLLRWRAVEHPERYVLTFLPDGEREDVRLTFAELDRRARRVAAYLQSHRLDGERVLLLLPSGADFITAFLGCLYAGAVAVPAYPPRLNRNLLRLRSIVRDATPRLALSSAVVRSRISPVFMEAGLTDMPWMAVEELSEHPAGEWRESSVQEDALAFLQYTSGSTADPKGVMVSHGNLVSNHRMIRASFGQSEETTFATWLPLFHDMGLIACALQAIYLGAECVVMPPEAFLMKPVRWLRAITRYRARCVGGPNFAFDLSARKIPLEQRAGLDLSSLDSVFVGAETVRAATMERFAQTFAPHGFRAAALTPSYGLAEATVFVTAAAKGAGVTTVTIDAVALEQHRVVPVPAGADRARTVVSCGHTWLDQTMLIVDPDTAEPYGPDHVGEIWVSGSSIARGYWQHPEESARTFAARANGHAEPFLRTGDLGFLHDGHLFIAGRIKDLIIIAGRNHHPVDIEQSVEGCHPAIRPSCCAVFSVDTGSEEQLVVVAELERSFRAGDTTAVERAVRQVIAEEHEVLTSAIVLLRPGSVPRTTSGKVQRRACREHYLAGTLEKWTAPS